MNLDFRILIAIIIVANISYPIQLRKNNSFTLQLVIVGGFLIFLYIFFALATSVYKDYKLEVNIEHFEKSIAELEKLAKQKPEDVKYYQSLQYKDKYAKENLNLLNPGEKVIIIPSEDAIVKSEVVTERFASTSDVLKLPNKNQWWEYFFGKTLSLETKKINTPTNKTESINKNSKQSTHAS